MVYDMPPGEYASDYDQVWDSPDSTDERPKPISQNYKETSPDPGAPPETPGE